MWHGIRRIDICIPANLLLPASLFTCETLAELHLSMESGPALHVPAKVYLSSLVVLKLNNVICFPYDDDACERLLSNCHVLEGFFYSWKEGDCKLVVCHPTLKRLSISNYTKLGGGSIWINAPNLVYLRYFGFNLGSFTLNLVKNHVQVPVFNNLTRLQFHDKLGGGSYRLENILYFLESLNSLETLYFLMDLPSEFNIDAWYAQEESTPSCLSFRFKEIKINSFRGSDNEMDMVKYLLQSARVLEVLDVETCDIKSPEKKLEIDKRLVMFPRASVACNVVLQDNNMLGTALS